MRTARTHALIVPLAVALVTAVPLAGQVIYEAVELGSLAASSSQAYGLNDYAQVVGRSLDANGLSHAFHWQNGELRDLNIEVVWGQRLTDLDYGVAYAISNSDQVVGAVQCTVNPPADEVGGDVPGGYFLHACIFRPATMSDTATPYAGTIVTYLGTLGGPSSAATGISRNGQYVVGWSDVDPHMRSHAFLVTPVGGVWASTNVVCDAPGNPLLVDLGTLQANDMTSSATAVNNFGQVVGWSYNATYGYSAFLWQGGTMTDLGTLGGTNSWARDINDYGEIVGESDTSDGFTQAFVRDVVTATMRPLGTLGGKNSSAAGINNAGQVVGWSLDAGGRKRAFIITPRDANGDGQPDQWFADADADGRNDLMSDLNDLLESGFKIRLTEARAINEHGEITGWGTMGSGETALEEAFLLTPTGATAGGSQAGGTHQDAVLEPVQAGGSSGGQSNGSGTQGGTDQTGGIAPLTPLHFLCGSGIVSFTPLALAGLCGLRWDWHRRSSRRVR